MIAAPRPIPPTTRGENGGGFPRSPISYHRSQSGGRDADLEPELLRNIRAHDWVQVISRLSTNPEEAQYVSPTDHFTALHLAIMARRTSNPSARIAAIRALLVANGNAAIMKCKQFDYTPLAYACTVTTDDANDSTVNSTTGLQNDAQVVRLIIEHNPKSLSVLTNEGLSPLDIHIMSFSKAKRLLDEQNDSTTNNSSKQLSRGESGGTIMSKNGQKKTSTATTVILRTLLEEYAEELLQQEEQSGAGASAGAGAVAVGTMVLTARSLDMLYECNAQAILDAVAYEEAHASATKRRARRLARTDARSSSSTRKSDGGSCANSEVTSSATSSATSSSSSSLSGLAKWWVWEWAVHILRFEHDQRYMNHKPIPPFNVVHAAAQVQDCPLPFLMLAMRAYPRQVRVQDSIWGNLPLHIISAWEVHVGGGGGGRTHNNAHDNNYKYDNPSSSSSSLSSYSSVSRKSMALTALVSEYPEGTKVKNKAGKTPLSLALETATPWDKGVRRLTHACQQ